MGWFDSGKSFGWISCGASDDSFCSYVSLFGMV